MRRGRLVAVSVAGGALLAALFLLPLVVAAALRGHPKPLGSTALVGATFLGVFSMLLWLHLRPGRATVVLTETVDMVRIVAEAVGPFHKKRLRVQPSSIDLAAWPREWGWLPSLRLHRTGEVTIEGPSGFVRRIARRVRTASRQANLWTTSMK